MNQHDFQMSRMRFPDLRTAGQQLATKLEAFKQSDDVIVLGIVLGGILVALEVAKSLGTTLDLVIIRRLLAPHGYGSQVCAVAVAGSLVIDEELPPRPLLPETPFDYFVTEALDQLACRDRVCRGGRNALDIAQKTVVLVDCGICTGSTMRAAIRALGTRKPARIIVAAPAVSEAGEASLSSLAQNLVCLSRPEPFGHVGLWYSDFNRPGDAGVSELLAEAETERIHQKENRANPLHA
jgi:putative phosphoribosyl transferase